MAGAKRTIIVPGTLESGDLISSWTARKSFESVTSEINSPAGSTPARRYGTTKRIAASQDVDEIVTIYSFAGFHIHRSDRRVFQKAQAIKYLERYPETTSLWTMMTSIGD